MRTAQFGAGDGLGPDVVSRWGGCQGVAGIPLCLVPAVAISMPAGSRSRNRRQVAGTTSVRVRATLRSAAGACPPPRNGDENLSHEVCIGERFGPQNR